MPIETNKDTDQPKNIIDQVRKSEQLISMILGILVVLLIGGLTYRYFQKRQPAQIIEKTNETQEEQARQEEGSKEKILPTTHRVEKGENLWRISEKYYQSGYNWVDIARENNLKNPDFLAVGQELKIPDVLAKKPTIASLPKTGVQTIEEDHYTVKKGDSLSKIAGAAYGDIFAWSKIWEANRDKISNPNLIFPGQTLKIPR